ncbi:MAG: hypothetical protein PVH12_01330 [Candidatus Bathyarchaeota archaeon]
MSNHSGQEMRVWIGFAASFAIAFLIIILGQERFMMDQVWAIWTFALCAGFLSHGILFRERIVVIGSSLSVLVTIFSLILAPKFFAVGWTFLGCAVAISSFFRRSQYQGLIGVYITLGGVITLLSVYLTGTTASALLVWMVLVGVIFITVGIETKNPITHFMGACWILVSAASYVLYSELMLPFLLLIFVAGTTANFFYLHRLLGRTPKIKDMLSFTARVLSFHGLKQPIDQYNVLAILIKGNIGAKSVIHDVMNRLESKCSPILLLGPTAPMQLHSYDNVKIAWITTISGESAKEYTTLNPEDPSKVSIFINNTLKKLPKDAKPIILGDFLDNMIPHMNESTFHRFYSDLASTARALDHTVVFIVNADIHSEVKINVVKRFADVIIENREREDKEKLIREVRVGNLVDNIHTDWEKF